MITPEKRFKLKTFIYYLLVEPWTEKITMPNTRTAAWIVIFLGLFLKIKLLLLLGLTSGLLSYLFYEYKNGKYIYWYRNRKFKDQKAALKKVREEKRNKIENCS